MKRVLIVLVVLVAIPVGMSLWDFQKAVRLRQKAAELCVRPAKVLELEEPPYLRGKLGVIDVAQNKWDPKVGSYLPPELMPERAQDIGTCVLLEWGAKVEGLYDVTTTQGGVETGKSQALARRGTCKVTLIDLQEGAVIAEKMIYGPPPADGFITDDETTAPSVRGTKPITEVEDWLFRLPRK